MRRTRSGPSIREFLQYYLLVLLSEKAQSKQELVREIKERSADNRVYRPTGILWPASSDMDRVLDELAAEELVELPGNGQRWQITASGKKAVARYEEQKQESEGREKGAEKLIELLEAAPSGSYVLDVGTGGGFLALKLAERGFRVLGIDSGSFDYSKDSIQEAQQQAASQGGNVEFRQADIRKLAEPDSSFDYVVSSQAVHCMENQRECLQAIHRLLKPRGKFLCVDFLVGLQGFLAHGFHGFLAISPEEWVELLVEVSFGNIRMYEIGDYLVIESEKM